MSQSAFVGRPATESAICEPTSQERAELARELGSIQTYQTANGTRARIHIRRSGQRWTVGKFQIEPGVWVPMGLPVAQTILERIRAQYEEHLDVARAVAPYLDAPTAETLLLNKLEEFLAFEARRLAQGQIRPRTYRELQGKLRREGGYFSFWDGWHIHAVTYGSLDEWALWLPETFTRKKNGETVPLAPKTINHALNDLRRAMRWMVRRGSLATVPEFPVMKEIKAAPPILEPEHVGRAIAALPWEDRGPYLALYHAIRPTELRAMDLEHWKKPRLLVERAMDGSEANSGSSPITKNRQTRRVGTNPILCDWIEKRVLQATPAERLERRGVPLFLNHRAKNPDKRWSEWALIDRWKWACEKAGVPYVSPYHLKHSAATELAMSPSVTPAMLQAFLGHASAGSVEHYLALGGERVEDLRR